MEFYEKAYRFLRISGYGVSKSYLRERMESHPDYPAIISFTDLLDEFRIDNRAVKLERSMDIGKLPEKLLIHTVSRNGGSDFKIIQKRKKGDFKNSNLTGWTGIALLIEEGTRILHKEHQGIYERETSSRLMRWFVLAAVLSFFLVKLIIFFNLIVLLYAIVSMIGIFFSIIIIGKEIGISYNISNFFCDTQNSGCQRVIDSKYGKFGRFLSLGDLSGIYFAGILLYISLVPLIDIYELVSFLAMVQLPALLITPVSIYYQIKLRSFCRLCFAVLLILWLQAICLYSYSVVHSLSFSPHIYSFGTIITYLSAFTIASMWLVVKPILVQTQRQPYQNIKLRKWRQNVTWFDALLPLHRKIDDSRWKKEICYGNLHGVLQFLIVSNPYCDYCAIAHGDLENLLEKHPEDIGVRIRFHLKPIDYKTQNKKYEATLRILNVYQKFVWSKEQNNELNGINRKILADWYTLTELEWNKKYSLGRSLKESELVEKSINWCLRIGIKQTPSFFVNGHEMPNPHTFKDLFFFISDYIEILKNRRQKNPLPLAAEK